MLSDRMRARIDFYRSQGKLNPDEPARWGADEWHPEQMVHVLPVVVTPAQPVRVPVTVTPPARRVEPDAFEI